MRFTDLPHKNSIKHDLLLNLLVSRKKTMTSESRRVGTLCLRYFIGPPKAKTVASADGLKIVLKFTLTISLLIGHVLDDTSMLKQGDTRRDVHRVLQIVA